VQVEDVARGAVGVWPVRPPLAEDDRDERFAAVANSRFQKLDLDRAGRLARPDQIKDEGESGPFADHKVHHDRMDSVIQARLRSLRLWGNSSNMGGDEVFPPSSCGGAFLRTLLAYSKRLP